MDREEQRESAKSANHKPLPCSMLSLEEMFCLDLWGCFLASGSGILCLDF